MQLQFKFLPKVYIPSERDVLTEILSNVSILERPIDALTSWFGQLSVSGERMCTILVNRLED